MSYNKASEEFKWKKWKYNEEELLRKYGVPEYIILELRRYDWSLFNSDRRFYQRQYVSNIIDYIGDYEIQVPINNIEDLLEYLENEHLFLFLKTLDEKSLEIIFYKFNGYSNHQISKMVNLSESSISKRIIKIRKSIKQILE